MAAIGLLSNILSLLTKKHSIIVHPADVSELKKLYRIQRCLLTVEAISELTNTGDKRNGPCIAGDKRGE